MPDVVEVLVMQAMAQRLQSWPAYTEAPSLVTRSLLSMDQYTEELATGPVLGVVRSSGSTIRQIEQPATFEHELRISIYGYVRGTPSVLASDKLATLRSETIRCLISDDTLAGLVIDLRPDPESRVDTDDGVLEPEAYFRETWRVTVHDDLS